VIQPKQNGATAKTNEAKSALEVQPLKPTPEINNPRQE
jgi:hypothetical protein